MTRDTRGPFALLAGFHCPCSTGEGAWASTIVGVGWGAGAFLVAGALAGRRG